MDEDADPSFGLASPPLSSRELDVLHPLSQGFDLPRANVVGSFQSFLVCLAAESPVGAGTFDLLLQSLQ